MDPVGIFGPTLIGLPAALLGLIFMIFIGSRMLPDRQRAEDASAAKRMYRAEFRVDPGGNMDGKTLEQAGMAKPVGFSLLSLARADGKAKEIRPDMPLLSLRVEAGDAAIIEVSDSFFYENRRESISFSLKGCVGTGYRG